MPNTVEFDVVNTPAGRGIIKEDAEGQINAVFANLFDLIAAIPSGPQGERGPTGNAGPRWVIGVPRSFQTGLTFVEGNVIYRLFPASNTTGLFRANSSGTTSEANFPATPVSNASWELVLTVPWGERGIQGIQGIQGVQGEPGDSAEVVTFDTDAEAETYSANNPLAIVISTEGM